MEELIGVTGAPRSGTSLLMQTLKLLGVRVDAPAFIPEHDGIREYNKKGFYELNLTEGIDDSYKGAVKLFGAQFAFTDKNILNKIIYRHRNREDAIDSFLRFEPRAQEIYDANDTLIRAELKGVGHLKISYEEFLSDAHGTILKIIAYLEIWPTLEKVRAAVENVEQSKITI